MHSGLSRWDQAVHREHMRARLPLRPRGATPLPWRTLWIRLRIGRQQTMANVICLGTPNRCPRIVPGPVLRGTTVRQGAPANKRLLAEVLPTSAPWEAPPPLKYLSGTFQLAVTRPPDLTRDLPPWVRMPSSD